MVLVYNLLCLSLFIGFIISVLSVLFKTSLMEKIFSLISVFVCLAFFLILHGFDFLPLVILLLYVGSIAVLFLFVVIILNPDIYNTEEKAYWKRDMEFFQKRYEKAMGIVSEKKVEEINSTFFLNVQTVFQKLVAACDIVFEILGAFIYHHVAFVTGTVIHNRYPPTNTEIREFGKDCILTVILAIFIGTGWFSAIFFMHCVDLRQCTPIFLTPFLCFDAGAFETLDTLESLALEFHESLDVLLEVPTATPTGSTDLIEIGKVLYQNSFGHALLIVGLILLVSIIGCILLSIHRHMHTRLKLQSVIDQSVRYKEYFEMFE